MMKVLEDGVLREMTAEEIAHQEKLDKEMQIKMQNRKPTFEDFIERIANAQNSEEVIAIAKEINNNLKTEE